MFDLFTMADPLIFFEVRKAEREANRAIKECKKCEERAKEKKEIQKSVKKFKDHINHVKHTNKDVAEATGTPYTPESTSEDITEQAGNIKKAADTIHDMLYPVVYNDNEVSVVPNEVFEEDRLEDVNNVPEPKLKKEINDDLVETFAKVLPGVPVVFEATVDTYNPKSGGDCGLAKMHVLPTKMTYFVDLNNIIGDGYNVLMTNPYDGKLLFVNTERCPEYILKVITEGYTLTPEDIVHINAGRFDSDIYHFIDFSGFGDHLKNMTMKDKEQLEYTLHKIMNHDWENVLGYPLYRCRFESYADTANFTLISDKHTRHQNVFTDRKLYSRFRKMYVTNSEYDRYNEYFRINVKAGKIVDVTRNGETISAKDLYL